MIRFLMILSAALAVVLSAPADARAPDIPAAGAAYDPGGNIMLRAKHISELRREHGAGDPAFVIPTRCLSACTMYLGLDHACARPEGTFGFHSARSALGFDVAVAIANRRMSSFYPPRLREWFRSPEGPGGQRSNRFVYIAAADLIARGEVRACRRGLRHDR